MSELTAHQRLPWTWAPTAEIKGRETTLTERQEAMELIRSLIDRVELLPSRDGRVDAKLYGELAQILALSEEARKRRLPGGPGSQLSMVAGTRNRRYLQLAEAWL